MSQFVTMHCFQLYQYTPTFLFVPMFFTPYYATPFYFQLVAKINVNFLRTLVHELRKPEDRLSKKRFHFQLADDQASFELSGFGHNAISPIGLKLDIPIIICNRILSLNPPIIYLGGGEVDVKLALPVKDLVQGTNAIVGDITEER